MQNLKHDTCLFIPVWSPYLYKFPENPLKTHESNLLRGFSCNQATSFQQWTNISW